MSDLILVGSLQYSPIFKSHCCAFGKQCEKAGYEVRYLFSNNYKWMLNPDMLEKTTFVGNSNGIKSALIDGLNPSYRKTLKDIIEIDKPSHIYMHNYHPFFNQYISKIARKNNIKFIQHVHEPYVEDKSVYQGFQQYWLYLFEYMQGKLLRTTDVAIVSSDIALYLFQKRYPQYKGRLMKIPLMYEDIGDNIDRQRQYILFIGPLFPAKNPEKFLQIIDYSEKSNMGLKFLLSSRSRITDTRFINRRSLEIFYKEQISDEELASLMSKSIMTITPYKTARQSSVVYTAYMCGTPVLSSNVEGLMESVHHMKTGYCVDLNADIEEWIIGINFIIENLDWLSMNCRTEFLNNFSEINWTHYFNILEVNMVQKAI